MGLPYMTSPEVTVRPDYSRGTVEELYQKIEADLEAGLPHISDGLHTQTKFHFNYRSANAFATKFYMTYGKFDKAIEAATRVLGNNPAQVLRNWEATKAMDMNNTEQPDAYLDKNNPATLLVSYPISGWSTRGQCNWKQFSHSCWASNVAFERAVGNQGNIYQDLVGKHEQIIPSGKSDTISIPPIPNRIPAHRDHYFDDEVLLYRAEAYILTNQFSKAFEDLTAFVANYTNRSPSYEQVINFYEDMPYYHYEETYIKNDQGIDELDKYPTPKKALNPPLYEISYGTDQEWLLHYVLHLRRILLLGEGALARCEKVQDSCTAALWTAGTK